MIDFFFFSIRRRIPFAGNPSHVKLVFVHCLLTLQEKEEEGRGRFKSHTTGPARIADREKKAPLKT